MAYDPSDDCPHAPTGDPFWQESDCYWFYDAKAKVGGFHRIGHRPADEHADLILWVFTDDGERYRVVEHPALQPRWRKADGQSIASSYAKTLGNRRMAYGWSERDCEATLAFEGFHEPRGWSKGEEAKPLDSTLNSGHLECAGRIRGELRIGARSFAIDALAHRDRSWGVRRTDKVVQHRMFTGTFGPELSFATAVVQFPGGLAHKAGFVARHGESEDIADVRIISAIDHDGLTVRAGTCDILLKSGERLSIAMTPVDGVVHDWRETYITADNIGRATYGHLSGFCDLELSINPQRGTYAPTAADLVRLAAVNGLSRRPQSPFD